MYRCFSVNRHTINTAILADSKPNAQFASAINDAFDMKAFANGEMLSIHCKNRILDVKLEKVVTTIVWAIDDNGPVCLICGVDSGTIHFISLGGDRLFSYDLNSCKHCFAFQYA